MPFRLVLATAAVSVLIVVAAAASGSPFAAVSPTGSDVAAEPPPVSGPVVLVGTAGVRWDDVDPGRTPALWSLLESGAAGTVAARSLGAYSCPADGWLAVSTGRLAADIPTTGTGTEPCNVLEAASTGEPVPGWFDYLERSVRDERDATPGLLGSALAAGHVATAAIGPGAAIATALTSGIPYGNAEDAPSEPAELAAAVAAAADDASLVVVDVGSLGSHGSDRLERVSALDDRVGAILEAVPADATVLVMSLADDDVEPHLQLAVARGPGRYLPYDGGLLGARSTRQPGLIQTTDLTPTLLSLLGVAPPSTLVGSPVTSLVDSATDTEERLQRLRDLDAAARAVEPYVLWFGAGLILTHLLAYGGTWLALRRRWGGERTRRRLLRLLRWIGVLLASVPVATYPANIVPWWRSPAPFLTLMAAVVAGAVLLALAAMLGPWRQRLLGPFGVVAAVTSLVLTADVVTGSRLMISSLLGLQPLVAGRFYGLGNVAFALFATGALLAATALADRMITTGQRGLALAAVLVIGVVAVVVDGAPGLGSDFGGPLAMIPAFAVLAFFVAQLRASWRVGLGVAAGTIAVVAGLSGLDWLRPADERTHLGRFIEAMANGETWQVVGRKLEQNVGILVSSPLGLLVPVVGAALAVAVVRPDLLRLTVLPRVYGRAPVLRPGLLSLIVLLALGFAVNDSGTAIPAVSFALAVPLIVSVCATLALWESTARHAR